ncbi:MAG: T9SS type A sorting domain-containing protein [Bacteroidales bacterium]|nr:T9SS type A sorting domain-containing protein [Bacteroidales bacterium]
MKPHLPLIILTCLSLQLSAQIKNTYSFAQGDTIQVSVSWDAWAISGDPILGCNIYRIENMDVPLNETLLTSVDSTYQFIDDTEFDPYFPPKYTIMAIRSSDTVEVAYAHGFSSMEFKTVGTDSLVMEFVVWNPDMCCLGVNILLEGIVAGYTNYIDPFTLTFPPGISLSGDYDYFELAFLSDWGFYADLKITEDFIAHFLTTVGIPEIEEPVHQLGIFPNPLTEGSALSFYLADGSHSQIEIYNLTGKKVKSVFVGYLPAGSHKFSINKNEFAPGLYFSRLQTSAGSVVGKMMVK